MSPLPSTVPSTLPNTPPVVTSGDQGYVVRVKEDEVTVVSVGEQGPPGPLLSPRAPLQYSSDNQHVEIAPGSMDGQGMIWDGAGWQNAQVVPSGTDGTVPYKEGEGFAGDAANLSYDASAQTLKVARLSGATIDGGNF